jgi:type II secretory ATPase GspE/PulE/Tfp pilus assembly ATPase PilB-like protein
VVMRILDKSKGITSLEKLGIEGLGYQNLMKAIQRPFGVCLATGPTGSGKSTSLYAILNRIATPNVNVVTLEDPVEYEMKGINQAQIRPKIGFTFADGLRSVLRQDPNIIMVGEIRDGETANMATQAALTGHLVLSTLHTNDAAGAIPRLTNMGIEPFLITSALNVAIGQRLVRKICPHCRKEVTLPPGFRNEIESDLAVIAKLNQEDLTRLPKEMKFYQGMGCDQCGGKGYQGRLGIYEVLTMSETIEELTLRRAPTAEIQSQAQKEGMLTMYQDGLIKVVNGTTTLDEVLRETANH